MRSQPLRLWPIVAHIIKRPRVLDDQYGNPLRFIIFDEQIHAYQYCRSIDDEKCNIKMLLVPRFLLIISEIQEPFPKFLSHIYKDTPSLQ